MLPLVLVALCGDPPAHAGTQTGAIRVSLTILDVCTLDTGTATPRVSCSAGAPYRILIGSRFATTRGESNVSFVQPATRVAEIAF
ncbi:hypothetical protein OH764_32615 (plasmid) [Burkholderia sp. M6-3]